MKKNIFKLLFVIIFAACCFCFLKTKYFTEKYDISMKAYDFSQVQLELEELKIDDNSIWLIKTENSIFALSIAFKNEGYRSFSDAPELLHLVVDVAGRGAGKFDSTGWVNIFKEKGIDLVTYIDDDKIWVSVSGVVENFKIAMSLLADMLTKANLLEKIIAIRKQASIENWKQSKFILEDAADEKIHQVLFAKGHPYYHCINEALKKIPQYTREQFQKCYDSIFAAKDACIVFSGFIDKKEIETEFAALLQKLSCKKNNFIDVKEDLECTKSDITRCEPLHNEQAIILFAEPIAFANDEEKFAARIANKIFGELVLESRLFKEIRIKAGLCYTISSALAELDLGKYFVGNIKTQKNNIDKVIELVKKEYDKFCKDGITQEELDYAKMKIFSNNVFMTAKSIVDFVANLRTDNVAIQNINSYLQNYFNLTVEKVNVVIKKMFHSEKLIFIVAN